MHPIDLSKDKLNLLVAYTEKNRFIACENQLPWKHNLKGDMRFLNKLIRLQPNTALIMGRKTYESIPKYKDVQVVVVSSKGISDPNTKCFSTFSAAVDHCKKNNMYIKCWWKLSQLIIILISNIVLLIYTTDPKTIYYNMYIVIFGGVEIYREAMNHSHQIYATIVQDDELKGDRIFPKSDLPRINISKQVNDFLILKEVPKTWEYDSKENKFRENGFKYGFFFSET